MALRLFPRLARIGALAWIAACGEHAGSADAAGQSSAQNAAAVAASAVPAATWRTRAADEPEIAGWLYLRAASETADSAERARLYKRVDIAVARDRIPWVEARARERFSDLAGALRAYRALAAPVSVFRLRAALATAPASTDSVRRDLVQFIATSADPELLRDAYALFDKLFPRPVASEQITIARAAARAGAWARVRIGFEHAGTVARLAPEDRFAYATALAHANLDGRAASVFMSINSSLALSHAAQYQGALALLRAGNASRARSTLRELALGSDTTAAAALSLLADLASDDGDDAADRTLLLDVVRRFPTTRFASAARFNAALIALILGQPARADSELGSLVTSPDYAGAATYWRGRARQALGDTAAARLAWKDVIGRDSTSYYAVIAAARLGTRSLHAAGVSAGYPRVAAVDSAVVRVGLLRQLGMAAEIQFENERLFRDAPSDSARLLATAAAFAASDQTGKAIALGRRALVTQRPSAAVFRLIYPIAVRDTIIVQSRAADIDPALVAALIRQESSFNPRATSSAGARGLMQLMPNVAKSIAIAAGIAPWSASMLYDPGINVTLGVRHLAPLIRNQPDLPRALAAYNAGQSRVSRWAQKRGADDPEMFTERIPFAETREYVKVVLRNREFYRALYAW